MKFIKVHNADFEGNPILVNLDQVTEITQDIVSDGDSGATIFFNTNADGLRINTTETFEEIENMLLYGKQDDAKSAVSGAAKEERQNFERFLETMRDGVNRECDQKRDCETCRNKEQSFVCWFRSLTNREIVKIGAEYERLRNFEQQENGEKTEKTGRWIPVPAYEACGGDYETWQAHGNPVAFYYCSECKEQAGLSETGEDLTTKYCPRCGARMVNGI